MDHSTVQRLTLSGIVVGVLLTAWMLIGALHRQASEAMPTVQAEWRCDLENRMCREVPK